MGLGSIVSEELSKQCMKVVNTVNWILGMI